MIRFLDSSSRSPSTGRKWNPFRWRERNPVSLETPREETCFYIVVTSWSSLTLTLYTVLVVYLFFFRDSFATRYHHNTHIHEAKCKLYGKEIVKKEVTMSIVQKPLSSPPQRDNVSTMKESTLTYLFLCLIVLVAVFSCCCCCCRIFQRPGICTLLVYGWIEPSVAWFTRSIGFYEGHDGKADGCRFRRERTELSAAVTRGKELILPGPSDQDGSIPIGWASIRKSIEIIRHRGCCCCSGERY